MEGGFSCTLPYELKGWSPAGLNCCVDLRSLCLVGDIKTAVVESIQSLNKDGIADAFAPNSGPYWGYANTTNRTGNYGRDVSIKARLDVCMGSNDTDSAIATNNATTCYNQYCGTSSNEYCNASGSDGGWSGAGAVCHDRCECAINGTTHSSCNQL